MLPLQSANVDGQSANLVFPQEVSTAEGKQLADELGAHFLEASAKTAAVVEAAFLTLAADIKARSSPSAHGHRTVPSSGDAGRWFGSPASRPFQRNQSAATQRRAPRKEPRRAAAARTGPPWKHLPAGPGRSLCPSRLRAG
jgi:hypothetical protein